VAADSTRLGCLSVRGARPHRRGRLFSVVELSDRALAGEALLWGIDTHNRTAHVGLSLLPSFRHRGLGTDVIRVLCRYAFAVLGLHRLQVETLADNTAMIQVARAAGFVLDGTLRGSSWVEGQFVDEVVLGLLAEDWNASHGTATNGPGGEL
jgi:RimJ/RimL family protein N-acetyltransferase